MFPLELVLFNYGGAKAKSHFEQQRQIAFELSLRPSQKEVEVQDQF